MLIFQIINFDLANAFPLRRRRRQARLSGNSHAFRFETLESRRLLVAEAESFNLTRPVDLSGLVGTPSATVNWGDGKSSAATISGGSALGGVRIRFDYSLDTTGFLNDAGRRASLDAAASLVTSRLADSLAAIRPSGTNTWVAKTEHPVTGQIVDFNNLNVGANEIVVFVGARELGGNQLGSGGPGGLAANGSRQWLDNVLSRGQSGALGAPSSQTDVGPWGGTLTFDVSTNWYFGVDQAGLQSNQHDFVTVATHELIHLLGFGTVASWNNLVSGATFTGPKARAAYDPGGNVPLSSIQNTGHFLETITDGGRKTLMGPIITVGVRETPTALDLAALDDIGWELVPTTATLTAQHVYADNGNYTITITGQGSTVGRFTDTTTASISNVAPTMTLVGNQTAVQGQRLVISNLATLSDPGFANPSATPPTSETFNYTINWGDNSAIDSGTATIDRVGSATLPTLASFDGSHTYATPGTYTVTVRASDDDGGAQQSSFQVVVVAPPALSLELNRSSISEAAGANAATLTIRRSGPTSTSPITVTLSSSDSSEATLPGSAVILAGASFVTVPVMAVDDNLLDGTQSVTLTASGAGLVSGTVLLSVTDRETITAAFTSPTIREDAEVGSFFLTVTRSNTDIAAPLTISISGNVPSEITVPATATIPGGSHLVRIPVQPINDNDPERSLELVYRIGAAGYNEVFSNLTLLDDEPPKFQNPLNRFNADGKGDVVPLDALRIINAISRRTQGAELDPETDSFNELFPDVNGDYRITPLDALMVINEIVRQQRQNLVSAEAETNLASPGISSSRLQTHDLALTQWLDGSLF